MIKKAHSSVGGNWVVSWLISIDLAHFVLKKVICVTNSTTGHNHILSAKNSCSQTGRDIDWQYLFMACHKKRHSHEIVNAVQVCHCVYVTKTLKAAWVEMWDKQGVSLCESINVLKNGVNSANYSTCVNAFILIALMYTCDWLKTKHYGLLCLESFLLSRRSKLESPRIPKSCLFFLFQQANSQRLVRKQMWLKNGLTINHCPDPEFNSQTEDKKIQRSVSPLHASLLYFPCSVLPLRSPETTCLWYILSLTILSK